MNQASLDILINVPLLYPEVNAVKYKTDEKKLALKFAMHGVLSVAELHEFEAKLHKGFRAYHKICGRNPQIFQISTMEKEGVIFITLYRDEDTLTEEEIDLYISFLKADCGPYLIKDSIDIIEKERYKKSLKKNLLHRIAQNQNCDSLWAFRQGGQVFVLHK